MRTGWFCLLAVFFALPSTLADPPGPSRKHHLWGQCAPGAWKIVSVVTKAIDERGEVTLQSTTESKTTLADIDDEGVTIEVRAMVETGGRRFHPEAQVIRQGFHGELMGRAVHVTDLGTGSLTIEDRKVPCRISRIECRLASSRTVATVYYSDTVAPYILKRRSVTTDLEGNNVLAETDVDVLVSNMPCEVLGDVKCAAQVKTVHKHANGTITTLAFVSPDVPGGIVAHTSKELDKSGRLVRQSVLKLVAFSFQPDDDRGLHGRKRSSRHRRTTGGAGLPPP